MSAGHHTSTRHHPVEAHEQAQLDRLMQDPVFLRALQAYTKEDDQDDVAYLGGSEDDGQTIDFDRHFVAAIEAGQVKINGKAYDPRPFIRVHEATEGAILRKQFSPETWTFPMPPSGTPDYTPAHRIAEIAERHAVEHALGPDSWKPYSDSLKPWIKDDESEQIQHPPPHILRQPYDAANQSPNSPDYRRMFGCEDLQQGDSNMAKLMAASRNRIPDRDFALSGRRYPIEDASHARNALSRGAQNASPAEQATIKRKVHAEYPSIQMGARMPQRGWDGHQYGARMSKQYSDQMPQGGAPETGDMNTGQPGAAPAFPARSHSLAMASATHLANMGHITTQQKSKIHNHARAQLAQVKAPSAVPYGALSPTPALRQPGTGTDRSFDAIPAKQRPPGRGMTAAAPVAAFKQYR